MGVKELLDEAQAVTDEKHALQLEMLTVVERETWNAPRVAELMSQVKVLEAKFLALIDEAERRND